ncbi:MAG: type II toxin-antitoxin system PemK/MazF family toxin [Ktedonobacteraceae bacterium]
MKIIKRGEIWIAEFDPTKGHEQRGTRPAVVISSDAVNTAVIEMVYVMPGSTTDRRVPNHVRVEPSQENGLDQVTFFLGEQMRAVSTHRLKSRIGALTETDMIEVEDVLILLLDLGAK